MNKKIIAGILVGGCLLAAGGTYLFLHKDMTGLPYSEIEAYKAQYPYKTITYSVTITGGEVDLELKHNTETVSLTDPAQVEAMIKQAEYLQGLTEISLGSTVCNVFTLQKLTEAFPQAEILYDSIEFCGTTYSLDSTTADLTNLTADDMDEAICGLQMLPHVHTVALSKNGALGSVTLDDAAALYAQFPDLTYEYTVELFGQKLSTDMERVEYFQVNIGDEGLAEFRKLLPMMHKLTYFKLDWCETTDEAMALLREEMAERGIKVVWRVFFANMNALTDTLKIWASWSMNDYVVEPLKYCNEVKYLDMGHAFYTNIEFVKYMPDLEVCILSDSDFVDLEPIRNCTKLTYLEMLTCFVRDLSPLEDLKNLEYLNISNIPCRDITPIYNLPNLKRVWSTMNFIPQEQVHTFKELHPDCETIFLASGDPTDFGWRYIYKEGVGKVKHPRYALLTEQFGYETWDYSRYPKGYVTEEITWESTGISPD